MSGLSAAYFLLKANPRLKVEVFEELPQAGGRLATLSISGKGAVDTGCQYLSIDDPLVFDFIHEVVPRGLLKTLPGPILCLPEGWVVDPSERFYFSGGMQEWSREIVKCIMSKFSTNFQLHLNKKVSALDELVAQNFDAILVTGPGRKGKVLGAKKGNEYWPCLNIVFAWNGVPWEITEFYAFRDLEMREGIIWLAHEGLKSGNPEVWVAQLSPDSSKEWRNLNMEELDDKLTENLAAWVPMFDVGEKHVLTQHYWSEAFPANIPDPTESTPFERQDLPDGKRIYYLGDGYLGVGRAENAIQSALAVMQDLLVQATA